MRGQAVTRIKIFLLLAATLLVLSGFSAIRSEPQDLPHDLEAVSRPSVEKAPFPAPVALRPLPDKYRVLLNRSIFARDGRAAARGTRAGVGAQNTPGLWIGPPGTEATLIFRGVTLNDGSFTAFIEDVTGGGVRRFNRGDAIAAGRIAGINLNGMDYESGRKITRVMLGQNLAGGDAPPLTQPTTAPGSSPPPEGNVRGPGRGRPPGLPPAGTATVPESAVPAEAQ